MDNSNQIDNPEIVLWMISTRPVHQSLFFLAFLSAYLLTLLGNFLIVLLIRLDDRLLHSPMYFFLSHLSLADIGFVSTTVPKILANLMSQTPTITFHGCLTQVYFFLASGNTDNFLLACMAYDRYVAVCRPLHYITVMSHKCCLFLVFGSWVISSLHSLLYILLISRLSFCIFWRLLSVLGYLFSLGILLFGTRLYKPWCTITGANLVRARHGVPSKMVF